MTQKVTSKDGTKIVYTKTGSGPVLIQILGALNKRGRGEKLADLIMSHFTVVSYDRRVRGDSDDSSSYSIDKEVQDIEAIIDDLGGKAYLYGHSSGGILVLQAALQLGAKIQSIAVYEVPYNGTPEALKLAKEYKSALLTALKDVDSGEAVTLFVKSVGVSYKQVAAMKKLPMWKGLTAMSPTLRYDTIELMESYPSIQAKNISVPAIVMYGEASPSFMAETAKKLSNQIPNATLQSLKDQTHDVKVTALAPILIKYLK
jgi:pimeloyl-ACP methyl ester carboxylesterase